MNTATRRIGVLTSGGDAQGMNPTVRAVVRAGITAGAEVYAVREGFQGLVEGGSHIRPLAWDDVAGIQHRGGTVLGSARSELFRERRGLRLAARHLVDAGIDRLVAIGGDGSLAGADELSAEWPSLLAELVNDGEITAAAAAAHPTLWIAGIVGSIDNDMVGTDMTVGADSALHRIVEAVDALEATADSHRRVFVVEIMGRRCGYLALTAALAGGADYALIPESPPADGWEDQMCAALRQGRELGRRHSIVLVAEGAHDRHGAPITVDRTQTAIRERLQEEPRITILGHVQRGGAPSAFDRSMATMLGYAAAQALLADRPVERSQLIGLRRNRVRASPLMRSVTHNRTVNTMVQQGRYDEAMRTRGESFTEIHQVFEAISQPRPPVRVAHRARIALLHCGGLAPGMNPAVRAAVRFGHQRGHQMLGVENGFAGFGAGSIRDLAVTDVEGWAHLGGAELGSRRGEVTGEQLHAVSRAIEEHRIDALAVVGGFDAYASLHRLQEHRSRHPGLDIPVVCLPATIDNNVPGTENCVGADTALNAIVRSVDSIKQSAMAARRCFVIETMGRRCGYLTVMSALSAGAEQFYLPEEGITLGMLADDVRRMVTRFSGGRRLFLVIRSEGASDDYTTDVVSRVFEVEGGDLFDVRAIVLAHIQQGGDPTPFDRVLAARFAAFGIDHLDRQVASGGEEVGVIGLERGRLHVSTLHDLDARTDWLNRRPTDQWWRGLVRVARNLTGVEGRGPGGTGSPPRDQADAVIIE